MPNCAKCPHGFAYAFEIAREDPSALVDILTDEEVSSMRDACLKCKPDELKHHNTVHINFDLSDGGAETPLRISREYLAAYFTPKERATPLPPKTEDALLDLLGHFSRLDLSEVCLVHALMNGVTIAEIGQRLGYHSRQAAHAAIKRMFERHPWTASVHVHALTLGAKALRRSCSWTSDKPIQHAPTVPEADNGSK